MWDTNKFVEIGAALRPACHPINFHLTFAFWKRKLLAIGMNNLKTNPRNLRLPFFGREGFYGNQAGTHSELSCIIKLGLSDTSSISFVNIRLGSNNELRMAKPCEGCSFLFKQTGFRDIFYSTAEGKIERC